MYKTIGEAIELANGLKRELYKLDNQDIDIVLCPPFTALSEVYEVVSDSNIDLGAQDIYFQEEGAFTGEVSPLMLKDAGCKYVIIGHSERRQYFNETDESVNKKIKAALAASLIPIVCVGETLAERESQKTFEVIERQLTGGFNTLSAGDMSKLIIAYEPVWAIGTGRNATGSQAQEVHAFIREWLRRTYKDSVADALRILYGGSVKPANTAELMMQGDIDGALVGGASLEVTSFSQIVKSAKKEIKE